MIVALIAAVCENGVIGKDNALPWRISEDLKRFKSLTLGHPVVMGRKTYESIGKPLPKRRNIVLTRDPGWSAEGAERAGSLAEAVEMAARSGAEKLFIIGGEKVYRDALPHADLLYLTKVSGAYEGDAFFPPFDASRFEEVEREEREGPPAFAFVTLKLKR
jgi:dihydrofolate reductase